MNLFNFQEKLGIQDSARFKYLSKSGCFHAEGIDDSKEFHDVLNAMKIVNISESDQMSIFKIIAGILHLGNITFTSNGNYAQIEHEKRKAQLNNAALYEKEFIIILVFFKC